MSTLQEVTAQKIANVVIPVADQDAAIEFYAKLGFEVGNTHTPDGGAEPVWAWIKAGAAQLMLARARDLQLLVWTTTKSCVICATRA